MQLNPPVWLLIRSHQPTTVHQLTLSSSTDYPKKTDKAAYCVTVQVHTNRDDLTVLVKMSRVEDPCPYRRITDEDPRDCKVHTLTPHEWSQDTHTINHTWHPHSNSKFQILPESVFFGISHLNITVTSNSSTILPLLLLLPALLHPPYPSPSLSPLPCITHPFLLLCHL